MGAAALLALGLLGCQAEQSPAPRPPTLRAAIAELLRSPDLGAQLEKWRLPRASFERLVVPSYHRLYQGYLAQEPQHARRLAAALANVAGPEAKAAEVSQTRHWADDPALSPAQARTRWSQPVQAVSWRVAIGGAAIDAVWVEDGGRFYLLDGIDDAALALLAQAAPDCAKVAKRAGRPGPCSDAVWGAVDGALRDRPEVVQRSCARALVLCSSVVEPGSR